MDPVPRGFRMVTPYLVAEDGLALLEFTKEAFGAEEIMHAVVPTGVHAEVRMGDTTLMMGGGLAGKKFPGTLQPNALHIYVEDVDAVTKRAVAAGATLVDEPRDQEYPISVVFPPSVEAKVAETAPPMHSGQENTWKEARLENGVQIQVPLFIAPRETVRIDVKTGRYLERVRGERKKGT